MERGGVFVITPIAQQPYDRPNPSRLIRTSFKKNERKVYVAIVHSLPGEVGKRMGSS